MQKISSQAISAQVVGGPLIDIHGKLIGINTAEGKAVSVFALKRVLDSIK